MTPFENELHTLLTVLAPQYQPTTPDEVENREKDVHSAAYALTLASTLPQGAFTLMLVHLAMDIRRRGLDRTMVLKLMEGIENESVDFWRLITDVQRVARELSTCAGCSEDLTLPLVSPGFIDEQIVAGAGELGGASKLALFTDGYRGWTSVIGEQVANLIRPDWRDPDELARMERETLLLAAQAVRMLAAVRFQMEHGIVKPMKPQVDQGGDDGR